MPRKCKVDDDDISWAGSDQEKEEEESESDEDYNDEDDNDGNEKEDKKPAAASVGAAAPKPTASKKDLGLTVHGLPKGRRVRKRKPLVFSQEELADESFVPSYERKTTRGGYAATASHRLKISKANKGKQPWNVGKTRSQQDIDKIRAAVHAHHKRKLQANLHAIGMTEEEYTETRRRIKLMRENVRRYKKHKKIKPEEEIRKTNDQSGAIKSEPTTNTNGNQKEQPAAKEEAEEPPVEVEKAHDLGHNEEEDLLTPRIPRAVPERSDQYNIEEVPEIFRRDFEWTPHDVYVNGDVSYKDQCPNGGPGGLICCTACTASYCDYLTATYNELEDQKVTKAAADLETVTRYLETNHGRLTVSVRAARRQPPPATLGET